MPGNSKDCAENQFCGPDYFGLYKSEIDELLSQDDGLLPFPGGDLREVGKEKNSTKESKVSSGSSSLFSNGIGALLSETKKERLNLLMRQGVSTLGQEVDEMENPVFSVRRIKSCLKCKEKLLNSDASASKASQEEHPRKKAKGVPPCSDLKSEHVQLDDDLRFILEQDSTRVEEMVQGQSNEISAMLDHMENNFEALLNSAMTSCRPMTLPEKQQLRKLIQKLPAKNLNRVVEIIEFKNPSGSYSCDELNVDLDGLDNVTLWRLYFYVETVLAAMGKSTLVPAT